MSAEVTRAPKPGGRLVAQVWNMWDVINRLGPWCNACTISSGSLTKLCYSDYWINSSTKQRYSHLEEHCCVRSIWKDCLGIVLECHASTYTKKYCAHQWEMAQVCVAVYKSMNNIWKSCVLQTRAYPLAIRRYKTDMVLDDLFPSEKRNFQTSPGYHWSSKSFHKSIASACSKMDDKHT